MRLEIKNMVCPRCISSVKVILENLLIPFQNLLLGSVELEDIIDQKVLSSLKAKLEQQGFQVLETKEARMVNTIKTFLIEKIHHNKHSSPYKLSDQLSKLIGKEYSSISKTFKKIESKTIEQFILVQKIERVKALLSYKEKTLSEIAFEMNYSSTAHLSSQFKKITGLSPSEYKNQQTRNRTSLDKL